MTESNPVQVLMDEHQIISSVEGIILSSDKQWETDKEGYVNKVNVLLEFFSEYSDKFHHHKEEEVLFKELRDNPDFLLNDIIDELEEHHETFRATVLEIKGALHNEDFDKIQSLLQQYINDLLDHIAVENDELFIMAESLFSEDELERMYFLFQDIDLEMGVDKKLELVKNLKMFTNE